MFDAAPLSYPAPAPAHALDASLSGVVTTFSAGAEIYAEGDRAGTLYQVAFGVVRVYRLLADGRRQICAFHMPGEIFGFETGIERHFFADAVSMVGLKTLRPGSEAELSHELLKLALTSLTRAHDHLLTVGRNDASGRVAAFLLEIAERQGTRDIDAIDLPMSRLDIADYLGLTIETVSRVFTRLKDQGVIRLVSTRHVEVLRWAQLEKITA